jgi:MerR family glutamine synthetase transcriptional repressor
MATNDSIYPISVVMSKTGLSARQIRYYETNDLIKPARSKGNQRLYMAEDVERLLLIKSLLEKGLNLDGIRAALSENTSGDGKQAAIQSVSPNSVFSSQRPTVPKLTSLYPVNNQEALNNRLQQKRK